MKLSTEYILYTLAVATVVAAVTVSAVSRYAPAVTTPKVSFDVVRLSLINDGTGLYLDMQAASTTNVKFCINFVELCDTVRRACDIVIGDGVNEAANLPVCIEPGHVFKLSLYHGLNSNRFAPGRTVLIRFYYSVESPRSTFVRGDPQHIAVVAKVIKG